MKNVLLKTLKYTTVYSINKTWIYIEMVNIKFFNYFFALVPFMYGLIYFSNFAHTLTIHQIMGLLTYQIAITNIWILLIVFYPVLRTKFMYYMIGESIIVSLIVGSMDLFKLKPLFNSPAFLPYGVILWIVSFMLSVALCELIIRLKKNKQY